MNSSSLLKKSAAALFLLSLLLSPRPFIAHAQNIGTTAIDGIDISYEPSNPAPGTSVTVTVVSYLTDLSGATITWFVGGKQMASAVGLTSISTAAPANGKTVQIVAAIDTAEGGNIKKVITLQSGDVDLVWETSGYTPPMFPGKVPMAYQNIVKFTAVPHFSDKSGKTIDPSKLIYKWSNGDTALGDQSGYGRQSIILKGTIIPRPFDISVIVSSADNSIHGQAEVIVNAAKPTISFYQDDPLYGVMYTNAIANTFRLAHNEVKVLAVPYGFDVNDPALAYDWSVNNVSQDSLSSSRSIVLRVGAGQQGSSNINLSMKNTNNNILQGATAGFMAAFNTTNQTDNSPAF